MVTTRSAEKRSDTPRKEDLVLRSRTISSPLSTRSTPTRSRKRGIENKNLPGSQPKRIRVQLNDNNNEVGTLALTGVALQKGADDDFIRGAEKHIDMSRSKLAPAHQGSDGDLTNAGMSNILDTTQTLQDGPESIPKETSLSSSVINISPSDKEETKNDVALADLSTDSSVHKEYETANEVIEGSDEAPEATRIIRLTRKSPRKQSQRRETNNDNQTTYTAQVLGRQDQEEPLAQIKKNVSKDRDAAIFSVPVEKPIQRFKPADNKQGPSGGIGPKVLESSELPSRIMRHAATGYSSPPTPDPIQYFTGATLWTLTSTRVPAAVLNASPDVLQALSGASTMQQLPTSTTHVATTLLPLPGKVDHVDDERTPGFNDALYSDDKLHQQLGLIPSRTRHPSAKMSFSSNIGGKSRLPSPARQSLSAFRRSRFEQRAIKSGSSFKFESNWKSKRSAFVVS